MAAGEGMDPKAARRLAVALCLSVAVHAALLSLLEARPTGTGPSGASTLQAWLERVGSDPNDAREENQPVLMTEPGPDQTRTEPPPPVEPVPADSQTAPVTAPEAEAAPRPGAPADAGMPLAADFTYYSVAALDTPPYPLGSTDLCYPEGASGEVSYVLLIDEAGTVNQASLAAVKPDGIFTAAAIEACRALKFAPGIKNGRAVRSRVRFVIGPSP
ncbi:MAG: hypothetical protein EHM59_17800 [Betaproteobacteria bacterium]|nr:MAG: hypothetical protein EHM59_17800 [Betaproteobacteria bacterium]